MSVSYMFEPLMTPRRDSILEDDQLDALIDLAAARARPSMVTASMFSPIDAPAGMSLLDIPRERSNGSSYSSSVSVSSYSTSPEHGPLPITDTRADDFDKFVELEAPLAGGQAAEEEYLIDRLQAREQLLRTMLAAKDRGERYTFDWKALYLDEMATGGPLVRVQPLEPPVGSGSAAGAYWTELYWKQKIEAEAKIERIREAALRTVAPEPETKANFEAEDAKLKMAWFGGGAATAKSAVDPARSKPKAAAPRPSSVRGRPAAAPRFQFAKSSRPASKSRDAVVGASLSPPSTAAAPTKTARSVSPMPIPINSSRFDLPRSAPFLSTKKDSATRSGRPSWGRMGARSEPTGTSKSSKPSQRKPAACRSTSVRKPAPSGRFASLLADAAPARKPSKRTKRTVKTYTAAEYFK